MRVFKICSLYFQNQIAIRLVHNRLFGSNRVYQPSLESAYCFTVATRVPWLVGVGCEILAPGEIAPSSSPQKPYVKSSSQPVKPSSTVLVQLLSTLPFVPQCIVVCALYCDLDLRRYSYLTLAFQNDLQKARIVGVAVAFGICCAPCRLPIHESGGEL